MKIAISGAHSTGKSSALKLAREHLEEHGHVVRLVSDLAVKCPLPILREHTAESSLWIAARGVNDEIACEAVSDIVLVDRPVVDAWGYLHAASRTPDFCSPAYKTLESLIRSWMPSYGIVFSTRLNPSIPIQDSKGRDLDEGYRAEVASRIREAYERFGIRAIDVASDTMTDFQTRIDAFLDAQK